MTASLTWIVHDRDEEDRVRRILQSLQQSEARDELGIGGIRDSIAEILFPGTSTIQTRLRYFLFVPWAYGIAEREALRAPRFAQRADQLERQLIRDPSATVGGARAANG